MQPIDRQLSTQFYQPLKQFILKRVSNKADAEDIVQTIFVKIAQGQGPNAKQKWLPWLYRVALNAIIDFYRAQNHRQTKQQALQLQHELDQIATKENPLGSCLMVLLEQLPARDAELIQLIEIDGLSLKKYAEEIEDDFLASQLISPLDLMGYPNREISIEVSEENLIRYGLTFDQVAQTVRFNNADISAGSIKGSNEEILIRSRAKENSADLIGEIVLRANPDGSKLLL
ncbi:MAG: efflux RND transporter permease subunit, partial [Pseudomonadota bacterium]